MIPFTRMLKKHPLPEALEAGQTVGAALDHLHLVDHTLGIAVGGRLVEVGEDLLTPGLDPVGVSIEGELNHGRRQGSDRVSTPPGAPVSRIDRPQRLLQPPGIPRPSPGPGQEVAKAAALDLCEPLFAA